MFNNTILKTGHENDLKFLAPSFSIEFTQTFHQRIVQLQSELDELNLKRQELELLYRQAEEERQRLREFIGTVIHEVRNPLNIAIGYNQFLRQGRGGPLSDPQQEFVASIAASLQQAYLLTEDLLCQSELERGNFDLELVPLDLKKLVLETLAEIKVAAEVVAIHLKGVHLEGTAWVEGSDLRLKQCLYNLIVNAIKFSPPGGVIEVEVDERETEYRVLVKDQGPGITPEMQELIFRRTFQVKDPEGRHRSGYGLGLAITAELIKRHGGEIGVISVLNEGSCFWFSLPRLITFE